MRRIACALAVMLLLAAQAFAMDAHVRSVHAGSDIVVAAVDIGGVVPKSLARVLDEGSALHLRLQAELWENRPTWDRLVYPALVRVFRIVRTGTPSQLVVADDSGTTVTLASGSGPFSTTLALGKTDRISATSKYYVHLVATVGTIADRDIESFNDAVFGRESESGSVASFGRFVMRSMLQLSDYLQSVTADTRGREVSGSDILKR